MDITFMKRQLLSRFRNMAQFIPGNDYQTNKFIGDTALAYAAACGTQATLGDDDRSVLLEMQTAVDLCFNHMARRPPGLDYKTNDAIAICGLASLKLSGLQERTVHVTP